MKGRLYVLCMFFVVGTMSSQNKEMSLSMQEAIDYAIKNSYTTKVAENDVKAAIKKRWETIATGLPQINGEVNYINNLKQPVSLLPGEIVNKEKGTFVPVTFGTKQTMNATVTLNQLLFDGTYLIGLQSAKTYLKISKQAKEKTILATKEAIINAYGNVLITEKTIEILERNKKVLEKNFNDAKKINENGLNEEEDVEQLEITLGNVESSLRNAIRLKGIAYQMLNLSLGNSINTKLVLTDNLDSLMLTNIDLELLTKTFNLEKHIDFRIAENDRKSKYLLMRLQQSKALPSLGAFLNYGAAANSNTFSFLDESQDWFKSSVLGISLKIPLFSSLGRSAKTAQAKIALASADIRLEEIKQKLSLQAEAAKSEYQLSIENYETAKRNLELAERIEKKQQIKFFEGISTSFDLSQAQNQLYSQQNKYVQSMLNVVAKKAKLENALNITIK
ncbi:TolC family protein [Tenacibaculum maritimum]|uniref:Outer membrane efflux protein n=2 Tax=Tenacibaculum maritimum TaxID=107401 RepID=A0A2H1E672_9FLAO|nr:TolC family protein [Tenacibaculum maritimum]SFZ80270.1 Outer membrane efflux protein precursor [Tenacibaculum maritimum NCIMB 2154]MCD9580858.1 TolC family protein [Tenacibaculum maritimum]MCD9635132.1 TolC family protein [Tenacibaculum maritimum]MDB0600471.1 TolC family protein [Tenacibaculum maritimum]MDB0610625.1 TolC family protein [Tenacibaculum maritimum]